MAILHQLRDRGHTVIIVTHDSLVAAQAERVIEIRDGEIVRNPPSHKPSTGHDIAEPTVKTASGWGSLSAVFAKRSLWHGWQWLRIKCERY